MPQPANDGLVMTLRNAGVSPALWPFPLLLFSHALVHPLSPARRLLIRRSALKKPPDILEDSQKHRRRQLACKRILLARMVSHKKPRQSARQRVTCAMPKWKCCQAVDFTTRLQQAEIHAHRNSPERKNRPRLDDFELPLKIRPAVLKLRWERFVPRRRAADRCRDVRIFQREPVIPAHRRRLIRKPRAIQSPVKKIARPVACKHPPRSVRAMRRGREPQNQQLCVRIAEPRHRLPPIFPIKECAPLFARHFFAVAHQPWTLPASNNLRIQFVKACHDHST